MWSNSRSCMLPHSTHLPSSRWKTWLRTLSGILGRYGFALPCRVVVGDEDAPRCHQITQPMKAKIAAAPSGKSNNQARMHANTNPALNCAITRKSRKSSIFLTALPLASPTFPWTQVHDNRCIYTDSPGPLGGGPVEENPLTEFVICRS